MSARSVSLHLIPLRLNFCYMQGPLHHSFGIAEALVQGLSWSWCTVRSLPGARLQLLPKDRQEQVAVGLCIHVSSSTAFDRHTGVGPQEGLFNV